MKLRVSFQERRFRTKDLALSFSLINNTESSSGIDWCLVTYSGKLAEVRHIFKCEQNAPNLTSRMPERSDV